MAWTTAAAFDQLWDAVHEPAELNERVRTRRANVVTAVQRAFPSTSTVRYVSDSLIGSLGRHTASRPFDDIDILVHLKVDDTLWSTSYQSDSRDFLYRVRNSLNDATTINKVGARGQAVRLFYTDGLSVDVAAVVKYTSGGYGIPDGNGNWLGTNPLEHESYMNRRNSELGNNLKRFVVIAKQWNKAHSSRLSSFHLEMMAARTFTTLGSNRREALRAFFNHNWLNLSVNDPAGYGGDLSSYLTINARELVNQSLKAARDRADLALAAEYNGDHAAAIRHWKIIMGDRFPNYG